MKRFLLTSVLLTSMTLLAPAQDSAAKPAAPGGRAGAERAEELKKLGEELKLTPEQQPKFKEAYVQAMQKMKEIREKNQGAGNRQEAMKEMKEAGDALSAKMKEFLTPEQYPKWETARDAQRARLRARAKDRPSSAKPAEAAK